MTQRSIPDIIKQLTLEEKAGLCSGKDTWRLKGAARLGVPEIAVSDGPHGLRKQEAQSDHLGIYDSVKSVCFPAACATAASFDEELLEAIGSALGQACREENIAILLGPAMNIKRSPLCGRNFEYFSENPLLSGRLAAAQIKGIQRWGVGACPKHFAANNQEFRRSTNSSEVDEPTLREIYLQGFELAVREARPWAMMCSYNKINGVLSAENQWLLTQVLREEWGFDGLVMSDWGAVDRRVPALRAGLDLEMPSSNGDGDGQIVAAVSRGELPEELVDRAAARILDAVLRYEGRGRESAGYSLEEQHGIAVRAAMECAVLLKNNGVLPLNRENTAAYIGAYAKAPRYQGGGSSHVNAYRVTGAVQCAANQRNITYVDAFGGGCNPSAKEILQAAQAADCAVVFAGLPDICESEGYDREHMRLPQEQDELIGQIAQAQPNTVVVLHAGSPVEMPWIDKVAAVLCMYLGGEGVGEAADALLYGDANPCGRLPETFPLRLEDTPTYLTYCADEERSRYSEGEYVGYRYYNAKRMPVLFPFGYGLSYTQFAYGGFALSDGTVPAGGSVTAEVTVTNTGKRAGKEVVQFYVHNKGEHRRAPVLAGFQKVHLEPGESRVVRAQIDYRAFERYRGELGGWCCLGGEFEISAGKNSREMPCGGQVEVRANRRRPLVVTRDTTLGKLLANPAAAEVIRAVTGGRGAQMPGGSQDEQARKAVSEMIANAPLRALAGLGMATSAGVDGLVKRLNEVLTGEKRDEAEQEN